MRGAQAMNVRVVAALLQAEDTLDDLERRLRLKNERQLVRKVVEVRSLILRAMAQEQEGLRAALDAADRAASS